MQLCQLVARRAAPEAPLGASRARPTMCRLMQCQVDPRTTGVSGTAYAHLDYSLLSIGLYIGALPYFECISNLHRLAWVFRYVVHKLRTRCFAITLLPTLTAAA